MKKEKKKNKLKKQKIKLSYILARSYYFILAIVAIILDLILIFGFKFDVKNITQIIILLLINIPVFTQLTQFMYYYTANEVYQYKVRLCKNASQARGGAPGTGKSSTMYYDGILMAEMAWRQICYEYFLIKSNVFKTEKGRSQKWDERAIIECYKFYKSHTEFIPCLYSKYTVYDKKGRRSQKLTLDHIQSKRKLLYRSVLLYDEIGQDLPAMLKFMDEQAKKDVDLKKVSDFMRYLRHFGNFKIIFTEQDVANMYIGNRRVTDLNRLFVKQEAVLQPIFFLVLQYFFTWYFAKIQENLDKTKLLSISIGKFLKGYDNFVRNLGYRKYTYKDLGNNDKSLVKEYNGTIYLQPNLNCFYNDRENKFIYNAVNNDYEADNMSLNEVEFTNDAVCVSFTDVPNMK